MEQFDDSQCASDGRMTGSQAVSGSIYTFIRTHTLSCQEISAYVYICLCVCACVCVRVRACVCVSVALCAD